MKITGVDMGFFALLDLAFRWQLAMLIAAAILGALLAMLGGSTLLCLGVLGVAAG